MKTKISSGSNINPKIMSMVVAIAAAVGVTAYFGSHASGKNKFDNAYLRVKPLNVSVTLDRNNPNYALMQKDKSGYAQGLIYGPGFTISDKTATGFGIRDNASAQGVGFYEASGGIVAGQTVKIHTYINSNMSDGTYTGSATLKYYANDRQQWVDGPAITYSITLIN